MNERIRKLRDDLDLSRAAFGQRIGVSGDVINNLERGRVEIKEHIIKLICTEYSVNEQWLRTGNGSMYIEPSTFSLDKFVKDNIVCEDEHELIVETMKAYFELKPESRLDITKCFRKFLPALQAPQEEAAPGIWEEFPDTAEEFEKLYPPVEPDKKSKTG